MNKLILTLSLSFGLLASQISFAAANAPNYFKDKLICKALFHEVGFTSTLNEPVELQKSFPGGEMGGNTILFSLDHRGANLSVQVQLTAGHVNERAFAYAEIRKNGLSAASQVLLVNDPDSDVKLILSDAEHNDSKILLQCTTSGEVDLSL